MRLDNYISKQREQVTNLPAVGMTRFRDREFDKRRDHNILITY